MLREEVLREWGNCKFEYRTCFIVVDEFGIKPLNHDENKMLKFSGVISNVASYIITNDSSVITNLPLEVKPELRYSYDGRMFCAPQMIILRIGATVEEVD